MDHKRCAFPPVHQSIFKERSDGIDVVLPHLTNILKEEGKGLEDTILDIQLRNSILIHKGREDCEWGTSLGNNSYSHSCADSVLSLLNLEVIQQRGQYIVRAEKIEIQTFKYRIKYTYSVYLRDKIY